MPSKLHLLLLFSSLCWWLKSAASWQTIIGEYSGAQPLTLSGEQLDRCLVLATKELPSLTVALRRHCTRRDADNVYTHWFLRSSPNPISVIHYEDQDDDNIYNDDRESYVIVTEVQRLHGVAQRFVRRAPVFFFVLHDFDIQAIEDVYKDMWQRQKNYKIYMLTMSGIWVYDPFEYDARLNSYGRAIRYDCQMPLVRQLFRDMRGYPLRVQMFRSVYSKPQIDSSSNQIEGVEGADALVAYMLQKHLNFTMILQDPDPNYFGERDSKGNYNGAIGSIINDGLDICLTGFFVKDYKVDDFMDFTVAVYDDELCIYVPKAKRIPQSILPIFAVGYDIWLGFILTAYVCALIWLCFRITNLHLGIVRSQRGKGLWYQSMRILIDTWVVWVRVNISRFPTSYSERIFIASLCLVSVIFGAIFESSLATVYIHPMYYKDINTLHDLDDSGLKVVYKYTSMADDLFFSETSKLFASLNKKLAWVQNLNQDVIQEVADFGGKAGVTRLSSLKLESFPLIYSKRVWVVPECPKYYTMAYVMPKDSPWEDAVNDLLLTMLNAGIIRKWINDAHTIVDIKARSQLLESTDNIFRVLTIGDLQLAFYVVLCGNMLALISFIAERWCLRGGWNFRLSQHKRK